MGKDKGNGGSHGQAGEGGSRVKGLRRELLDLEGELERARRRRDKAQARLEALEAIAEQLATSIVAAEAANDARRARRAAADAAAAAAGHAVVVTDALVEPAPVSDATPEAVKAPRRRAKRAAASQPATSEERTPA